MKGKDNTWLMAIVLGVFIPGIIFSIAEKLYSNSFSENMSSTVMTTIPDSTNAVVRSNDTVLVFEPTGIVKQMDMNEYLTGVLLGELPADFSEEALKAQAVVARTYAKKRMQTGNKHPQGAVCTESSCCQAYCSPDDYLQKGGNEETVEKFSIAVYDTAGLVLTYQGALIEATYFSCSGGKTEDAVEVWGTQIPYLQAVDSPGEENAVHYQDHIQLDAKNFATRLGIEPIGTPNTWFGNVTYTSGGGVDTIIIAGNAFRGLELRERLGLYSTVFTIVSVGNTIHIYTKGFGHRVGMSQYGAEAMAVGGNNYRQILSHYYSGTDLVSYFD